MKRSEMINKIHDKLVGTSIQVDNWEDHLLVTMEELGMRPPKVSQPFEDIEYEGWDEENEA